MSNRDYIHLNRVFIDLSESEEYSEHSSVLHYFGNERGKSLAKVVENYQVSVILAEARSGKTTEFLKAARTIRESGRQAFFLRLEDLSLDGSVGSSIEDAPQAFDAWINSSDPAVFFLDAVDEAKLSHPRHFARALRVVRGDLQDRLHDVKFCLSSRHSEWRQEDLNQVQKWSENLPNSPTPAIMKMLALDHDRI